MVSADIWTQLTDLLPLIALGGVVLLLIWNGLLEWRLRRATRGSKGENLEQHIARIARDYEEFVAFRDATRGTLATLDTRMRGSISGVGLVKFNPFAGHGASKPSFAAAFVSEDGSGVIISTLHARESVSIFSKTLVDFASEYELTEEEAEALDKARESLHTS